MLEQLNNKIREVKTSLRRKDKVKGSLEKIIGSISVEKIRLKSLKAILDKEHLDVKKLEGLSVAALFHAVKGSKSAQLEKEKQEYLAAKLKYDECCEAVKQLEIEEKNLYLELKELKKIDEDYKSLLKEKEEYLTNSGAPQSKDLMNFSEQLADLESDVKELTEAVDAAEAVKLSIDDVLSNLRRANSSAAWDTFTDSFYVEHAKYSSIDSAKQAINKVQQNIRHLQIELQDVNQTMPEVNIHIDITGFEQFADRFFDNWISDWTVKSKIGNSIDRAQKSQDAILRLLNELHSSLAVKHAELKKIKEARDQVLESIGH